MSIHISNNTSPIVVNFSSERRASGSNSNFWSAPIDLKTNKYDTVCLLQTSIPKSNYNIDDPYDQLVLSEDGISILIKLPQGSYDNLNIMPVLEDLLNNNSPNGWVYKVYYNSEDWKCSDYDTFKFLFTVTGNGLLQPSFVFSKFSLARQFGFPLNSTNTFSGGELRSTNCINMGNQNRAFIKSTIVVDSYLSILEEVLNFSNFGPGQLNYYQQYSVDLNSRSFNNSGLNSWHFILVDSNDNMINLQGIPWSFSCVFFQRSRIHELHGLEMKIQNELRLLQLDEMQKDIMLKVNERGQLIENLNIAAEGVTEPDQIPDLTEISPEDEARDGLPIFPVLPYGSSSIVKDVTSDSVDFPKEIILEGDEGEEEGEEN